MAAVNSIIKKLEKAFGEQVEAFVDDGCLVLSGELPRWSDVVRAGKMAAGAHGYPVVNNIECKAEKQMKPRRPHIEDSSLEWEEPDVLIIGGGVIGCAIARELSRYKLGVLLVEKEYDVAIQTTGRSTGIVHSGLGFTKGSLKQYFTKLGNAKFETVCSELGVPFVRSGQFFAYTNPIWRPFLLISHIYWWFRGVRGGRVSSSTHLSSAAPGMSGNISAALHNPHGGIVDPKALTIAYAENAITNGAVISLNTMVQGMAVENGKIKSVTTNRGTLKPKVVVNAAGVFCEEIAAMAGDRFYSIRPIKGTSIVLDKKHTSKLTNSIVTIYGRPRIGRTRKRRAEIIANIHRTVNGNVLSGPFSAETIHKEDFSVGPLSVEALLKQSAKIMPEITQDKILKCFAGIFAATYEEDFVVSRGRSVSNLIHAAGISVPGLTASPAIAEDVAGMVLALFGSEHVVEKNAAFNPKRTPPPVVRNMDINALETLVSSNPDYGVTICHCEHVTKGEILETFDRNLRPVSLDSIRNRVRTGCGSCQGQNCIPHVHSLIVEKNHSVPQHVRKRGSKSELLYGDIAVLQNRQSEAISDAKIGHTHELERTYD